MTNTTYFTIQLLTSSKLNKTVFQSKVDHCAGVTNISPNYNLSPAMKTHRCIAAAKKTTDLSYGIKISAVHHLVLTL